jgi:hypothetical protein
MVKEHSQEEKNINLKIIQMETTIATIENKKNFFKIY